MHTESEIRDRFTSDEAAKIRALLRAKARADSADQKALRDELRNLGFWIENFAITKAPFRSADFEALVQGGVIKVTE